MTITQIIKEKIQTLLLKETADPLSAKAAGGAMNDLILDAPFIVAQLASITAGQLGRGYLQIILINATLLVVAKLIFAALRRAGKGK